MVDVTAGRITWSAPPPEGTPTACPCCSAAPHSDPLAAHRIEGADAPEGPSPVYRIAPGDTFEGSLGGSDQTDWIAVRLVAGQTYDIAMIAAGGDPVYDPYLWLTDANGNVVAQDDDGWGGRDAALTFTATRTGIYYIVADTYYDDDWGTYAVGIAAHGGGTDPDPDPTEDPTQPRTVQQIAHYLTDEYWAYNNTGRRSYAVGNGGVITCDLTDLTAAEKAVAKMALNAWTQVTGIRFDTTSTAGARAGIEFVNDDAAGAYARPSAGSGSTVTSSLVNIPSNWAEGAAKGFDTYFYQTYLHEIGHALGLGHAGPYNGSATYGRDNAYANDSWQATVMSYFSQTANTAVNASFAFIVTPMIADILAVQELYGISGRLNGGNSVWGVGANTTGAFKLACGLMCSGKTVALTILDQGGRDLLNLSNDTRGQTIRLDGGEVSSVYGKVGNLSIAVGTVIESLSCGSGSDNIWGNAAGNVIEGNNGNDTLRGGAGADRLVGGAGTDRLYGGTGNDIYLWDGRDQIVELANEGRDTMRAQLSVVMGANIEALVLLGTRGFSASGNNLANVITGNAGANRLSGGAGNDTLSGGAGADTLIGGDGADRLIGGAGNDVHVVGAGDSVVELSGGGNDTITSGGSIVLPNFVEAGELTGGANVALRGNAAANRLTGNTGNNVIDGSGGNDILTGGGGADVFYFRALAGSSTITDFRDDIDTIRIVANDSGLTVADVLDSATQSSAGTTLRVGAATILVAHTTIAQLQDDLILI